MATLVETIRNQFAAFMVAEGQPLSPAQQTRLLAAAPDILDVLGSSVVDTPLKPITIVREKAGGRLGKSGSGDWAMVRDGVGNPVFLRPVVWDDTTMSVSVDPASIEEVKPI
jgi:hypothetical protein